MNCAELVFHGNAGFERAVGFYDQYGSDEFLSIYWEARGSLRKRADEEQIGRAHV